MPCVSVRPYPVEGTPLASDLSIFSTRSGCSAAPPPPMPRSDDVSRLAQSGWAISSSARPASHLYVKTILPPVSVHGCRRQLQAVTWNNGVGAMNTAWAGSGGAAPGSGAGRSPAAIALASARAVAMAQNARCMMFVIDPRWVSWAPFGKPVVPDV